MGQPWMPLYVGDYVADTAHLTHAEHGVYLLLLMHYWANRGLPNDDRRLARIARMTNEEWSAVRGTMAEFFDEGWKHSRIEFELDKADKISAAGRAGGVASGEARRAKRTVVERSLNDQGNDSPTKCEAPQPQPPSHSPSQDKNFKGFVSVKREGASPPRHGATTSKAGGRIYIRKDTPEWTAYAEDYFKAHGHQPMANEHGGKWFKTAGEASVA